MKHILVALMLLFPSGLIMAGSVASDSQVNTASISDPDPPEDDSERPSTLSLLFSIIGDVLLGVGVAMVLTSGTGLVVLWVGTALCALALMYGVIGLIRSKKRDNRLSRKKSVAGIITSTVPFALFFILLATLLLVNPF